MVDRIRCPKCGSERIAMVLYGLPALDDQLNRLEEPCIESTRLPGA